MENKQIEAYVKWLTKKGKPQLVTPLKFLGLRKNQKGHTVTFYDDRGYPYNGEVWECRTQTGKIRQFTFPVETSPQEEVGWSFNTNPIEDNSTNLHNDEWEYDGENYVPIQNEVVLTNNEKKVIAFLEDFVSKTKDDELATLCQLKLMILTTPSLLILKEYNQFKNNHSQKSKYIDEKLEEILN